MYVTPGKVMLSHMSVILSMVEKGEFLFHDALG